MKKAILIVGSQGSGKSKKARELAQGTGDYTVVNWSELSQPFGMSFMAARPNTVIVEDSKICTIEHIEVMNSWAGLKKLNVEIKGSDRMEVDAPNWIFVTGDPMPVNTLSLERRFAIIEMPETKASTTPFTDKLVEIANNQQTNPNEGDIALAAGFINALRDTVHYFNAKWWKDLETGERIEATVEHTLAKLTLVHSEVSECAEGVRKGIMDDHLPNRPMDEVEAADAIIRILDLAAARGWDVGGALIEKCTYNIDRADHSDEARKADGGKKA